MNHPVVGDPIDDLDAWLRGDFVRINTALEEAYFAERVDGICGRPDLDALKTELLAGGGPLMVRLAGLPMLPEHPRAAYRLLGLIGHYLAACRRHEAPLSERDGGRDAAWGVSIRIGDALDVVSRFVFAHQSLFNEAIAGRFRTFTSLPDEEIFIRLNALGVIAYQRAAHALRGLADVGVRTGVIQLSTSAPGPLNDSGNANPDNAFRFVSSGEYLFNLKTTGLATGTYALTFTATGDPNPHQVQFQIR